MPARAWLFSLFRKLTSSSTVLAESALVEVSPNVFVTSYLFHAAIFQHCRSSFSFSTHANSCQKRVCLHRQMNCVFSGTSRTVTTSRSTIQHFPSMTTCRRRLQCDLRHVLRVVRPGFASSGLEGRALMPCVPALRAAPSQA